MGSTLAVNAMISLMDGVCNISEPLVLTLTTLHNPTHINKLFLIKKKRK